MKDSVTYSMGLLIANDLKSSGIDKINTQTLVNAINDFEAGTTKMTLQDAQALVQNYKTEIAKEEGTRFLAANSKKAGVVTLPSGLQYTILSSGAEGPKPGPTSTVTTHYHGTLITGEVFDSSVDRGEPISFPVNGVIKGWTEALQLMSAGDKWRLFIPSDLAYGARGAGGIIKPHAALVFDVELISFK